MYQISAIALTIFLYASCKPGSTSTNTASSDTALTAPADNPPSKVGKSYQGTWFKVVQKDSNNFVVFRPCGQDMQLIRVSDNELYEQTGIEFLTTRIKEVVPVDSNTVIIKSTGATTYTFSWKNRDKYISTWMPKYSATYPEQEYFYVDSAHASFLKWEKEPGCQ
ncbi:hypothetical protein [Chitinophaga silvatica]|nr:hypothetical protein [Chitinophaga silvatica]